MDIIFCKITHFMDINLQLNALFFHPDTYFPVTPPENRRDAARHVSTPKRPYKTGEKPIHGDSCGGNKHVETQ